jgi:hypothetical protein
MQDLNPEFFSNDNDAVLAEGSAAMSAQSSA